MRPKLLNHTYTIRVLIWSDIKCQSNKRRSINAIAYTDDLIIRPTKNPSSDNITFNVIRYTACYRTEKKNWFIFIQKYLTLIRNAIVRYFWRPPGWIPVMKSTFYRVPVGWPRNNYSALSCSDRYRHGLGFSVFHSDLSKPGLVFHRQSYGFALRVPTFSKCYRV